ncbi:hypothetical protein HPB47_015070 [Ixodes persulcatus]|uniref:Uncharacterized protein n=1 Tax=Ixodes persulcatus TaxID=34615 RepID=A0AC60R0I3_IXOPE|nr:hypothetical protein HPB47_015070 [Ixodes persulcatus]
MPTFLQLYTLLSVQCLLWPPKFGNCEVLESEPPMLLFTEFKAVFRDNKPTHHCPLWNFKNDLMA